MGKQLVAGVDEVGRGCLAGPVFSAAVILDKDKKIKGLKDSKLLSPKKRFSLFEEIKAKAISIGIGSCSSKTIDRINIREATFSSMRFAVRNLSVKPNKILVDGDPLKKIKIPVRGIIKGDRLVECIMAASIIAKVTRDRLMIDYSFIFPEFDFENNKGYGTKSHLQALKKYKSTPIHRNSFKPVKKNKSNLKWIIENNKTHWLSKKLIGLFLKELGHKVLAIDYLDAKKNTEIDIITLYKSKIFFTEVFSTIDTKNNESEGYYYQNSLEHKDRNIFTEIKNKFHPKFDYQIDRVYIRINTGPPKFNRIENVYF